MKWLALDIGGANLKLADGFKFASVRPFMMWRESAKLAQELRTLISEAPRSDHLAVTMTGELADCFESKEQGVTFILDALREAADNRHTRVYLADGRLVAPPVAMRASELAAASNWHALANFAGRFAPQGPALLVDVGSTTCDIIPLLDGKPAATGLTDTQRLLSGELLYTGVERSPVCAVVRRVPYRGRQIPVVHELFATLRDVYLLLDELPEVPLDSFTADGRPATIGNARRRLGRMIAADNVEFNHHDAVVIAREIAEVQRSLLAEAVQQVLARLPAPPQTFLLSGHGEFLGRKVLDHLELPGNIVSLGRELGAATSRCATAHALAVLAREAVAS